jgi:CheY-like chemotaxis protein
MVEDRRSLFDTAGVALILDAPDVPVWIYADPTRITQVLANLLENAVKFSERGGTTHLIVRTVRTAGDGSEAVVVVRDTGIGIAPHMLPHLFDVFSQADRSLDRARGGLGLGLSLAKGLIELHGGRLEARSEGAGRGAEFTVSLPVAKAAPALLQRDVQPVDANAHLRVLVIEDNRDAADSLQMLLEFCGHDVSVAYSGDGGLMVAKEGLPDAIVCDIGLPGMDGYAIARALRHDPRTAGIRLIALTGYGQEENRREALEAGFDSHLIKPVDPQILLKQLEQVTS